MLNYDDFYNTLNGNVQIIYYSDTVCSEILITLLRWSRGNFEKPFRKIFLCLFIFREHGTTKQQDTR